MKEGKSKEKIEEFWNKIKRRHEESSIGLLSILKIVVIVLLAWMFIMLKCFDMIDWSWTWVLSPLWIPIAWFFLMFAILLVGGLIIVGKSKIKDAELSKENEEFKEEEKVRVEEEIRKKEENEKEKKEKKKDEVKKPRKPRPRPKKKVTKKEEK